MCKCDIYSTFDNYWLGFWGNVFKKDVAASWNILMLYRQVYYQRTTKMTRSGSRSHEFDFMHAINFSSEWAPVVKYDLYKQNIVILTFVFAFYMDYWLFSFRARQTSKSLHYYQFDYAKAIQSQNYIFSAYNALAQLTYRLLGKY